jgi:hypothetical protein
MRIVQGINTADLPDQFDNAVPGRTLILDGDGPCYVASATAKRIDTALRHFQSEMLKRMFLAKASDIRIHLTSKTSTKYGRYRVIAAKPYQGQRKGKAKPAMLEPLREMVADNSTWLEEYCVIIHRDREADDGMMQDAYHYAEDGVINSEDKDLRMTPYPYYEIERGQVMPSQPHGWVSLKTTPAGNIKMVGQGPMFFWAQMLAGDTADNVAGILRLDGQKCGPSGAYNALKDITSVHDAANLVLDGYREINQNAVAEGWLLWLTRWHDDNVIKYMQSLELSPANADFVNDCLHRQWVKERIEQDERDTNN